MMCLKKLGGYLKARGGDSGNISFKMGSLSSMACSCLMIQHIGSSVGL